MTNNSAPSSSNASLEQMFEAYHQMASQVEEHRRQAMSPRLVASPPSRVLIALASHLRLSGLAAAVVLLLWLLLPAPDGYCMSLTSDRHATIQSIQNTLSAL